LRLPRTSKISEVDCLRLSQSALCRGLRCCYFCECCNGWSSLAALIIKHLRLSIDSERKVRKQQIPVVTFRCDTTGNRSQSANFRVTCSTPGGKSKHIFCQCKSYI